jgi:hypothetical protein
VTLKTDLKQRDLERYEERLQANGVGALTGLQRASAGVVKSAIEAGWLDGVAVADIPDMAGRDVRAMAKEVLALYDALTNIDPQT